MSETSKSLRLLPTPNRRSPCWSLGHDWAIDFAQRCAYCVECRITLDADRVIEVLDRAERATLRNRLRKARLPRKTDRRWSV